MGYDGSLSFNTKIDESGFNSGISKLGSIAKGGLAVVGAAVASGVAAFGALTKASLDSAASLEQNIGGVETLFKNSADTVIANANRAYKTAGMSANEYMSTVTSFSASLLQSLSGDTEAASAAADMAITDMSDNANKMGTSMELIQNAYQGFAKQNYTMLDNLKLGYGGTKTEMERLLKDAQEISGVKYDISNLNDVYSAIHVIQEEMGITGTTAKEASTTIEGSIASTKAAWDNFMNGSGSAEDLADSVGTAAENIITKLGEIVPRLLETIPEVVGSLWDKLTAYLEENGDSMLQTGVSLVQSILSGIVQALPQLIDGALQIVESLSDDIFELLPMILDAGISMLLQLVNGIAQALPELIPQAINCILALVDTLLNNIDLIIDCGINLLLGLAEGIGNALPELLLKVPYILNELLNAFIRNLPKLATIGLQLLGTLLKSFLEFDWGSVGKNILDGISEGLEKSVDSIVKAAKKAAKSALDAMKNLLGIHSPSTVMRDQIGKNMGLGVGEGFEENVPIDDMTDTLSNSIQKMKRKVTSVTQSNPVSTASEVAESYLQNNHESESLPEDTVLQITNVFEVDGTKLVEKTTKATIKKINSNQKDKDRARGN